MFSLLVVLVARLVAMFMFLVAAPQAQPGPTLIFHLVEEVPVALVLLELRLTMLLETVVAVILPSKLVPQIWENLEGYIFSPDQQLVAVLDLYGSLLDPVALEMEDRFRFQQVRQLAVWKTFMEDRSCYLQETSPVSQLLLKVDRSLLLLDFL
jgi:hypothetical protein